MGDRYLAERAVLFDHIDYAVICEEGDCETRELREMLLLKRGNRLSITPVSKAEWEFILSLE